MFTIRRSVAVAALTLVAMSQQASASTLYDNGQVNGTITGWTLSSVYAVSDSFTLSQASILTGVNFGVWILPTDVLTSVDWAITSTPGTYPVTGTAAVTTGSALTPTSNYGGGGIYQVSVDSFSLPNISLAAGTYYLVLQNSVTVANSVAYWDENDGPSSATENATGSIGSESFQILGDAGIGTTPLPAALPLFASGLGGLGLLGWRRKKKAAALAA